LTELFAKLRTPGGTKMKRTEDLLAVCLILPLALSLVPSALAKDHILTQKDLHQTIRQAVDERNNDLKKVRELFLVPEIRRVFERNSLLGLDQIEESIPLLSDHDLAQLAIGAEDIKRDFEAGALSNEQLTYIVVALATAVIILVIIAD
jgi:hypothetical protein